MTHEVALWSSPNGVRLPAKINTCDDLMRHSLALKSNDTAKIVKAYDSGLYDMAVEYAWARTVGIIRKKISSFGDEFVAEMLGRTSESGFTISSVSEPDLINLATDLGLINEKAQIEFLHVSTIITHHLSNDTCDELDNSDAMKYLKDCVKYVLAMSDTEFCVSFISFRDKLKNEILSKDDPDIQNLGLSPYFFKRTTLRTLLSLAKSTSAAELEKVMANLILAVPVIWEDLLSDDKYSLGASYSEAVSKGNKNLSSGFKKALLKVNGFDYVPENLRSNTFIQAATRLLDAHYGMNNFYNEPEHARNLSKLGTTIPAPALGACMTAVLACKIGNGYGVSNASQSYLDKVLATLTPGKWEYYFNEVLVGEQRILRKFLDVDIFNNWVALANNYLLTTLPTKDVNIGKIMRATADNKHGACCAAVKTQLAKLR